MAEDLRVGGWVSLTSVDDLPDDYVYWLDRGLTVPVSPGRETSLAPAASTLVLRRDFSGGSVPDAFRVRQHRAYAVPVKAITIAAAVLAVPAVLYGASTSDGEVALPVLPPFVAATGAPSQTEEPTTPDAAELRGQAQQVALPPRSVDPTRDPVTRPVAPPSPTPPVRPPARPEPQPVRVVREAEASGNVRHGSVGTRRLETASSGAVVGWIGNGRRNTLEFTGLTVPTAGTYQVTVHYVTAEWRRAGLVVNGRDVLLLDFPSTGNWENVGQVTVQVRLDAGTNTLEFGNPHYWAPDLDRLVITR
ncbi:hypothetical protein K1W54_26520 [Micromonospora sp. CPCC 205371]|nr:hypothetical protein [Micromonospora sp. CPCC 205371]